MKQLNQLSIVLVLLPGCMPRQAVESPVSETISATYAVPVVTPVEHGSEIQERSGVVISVIPASYQAKQGTRKLCEFKPHERPLIGFDPQGRREMFVVTSEPTFEVSPSELTFVVNVTNRTKQVLRLEGSILKLNINGQEVTLNESSTKAFLGGVLTPNEAKSFTVIGPGWTTGPAEWTMSFALAGVPVEIDKAGNVVERSNFMWNYTSKLETRNEQGTKAIERKLIDPAQAEQLGCDEMVKGN